jgi:hypothetical protein
MTASIETRGASHGFREYGRWYLAVLLVTGTQPAIPAAIAPAPIVFNRSRRSRRFIIDIELAPSPVESAKRSWLSAK